MGESLSASEGQDHFLNRFTSENLLYLLNIFLLSDAFNLEARDMRNLEQLTQFVLLIYARYFLHAGLSTGPLILDISLIYEFKMFGS